MAVVGEKLKEVTSSIVSDVHEFRTNVYGLTVAAFAAIFTWGFVQGLKRTLLTPVLTAYVIPVKKDEEALQVPLKGNQRLLVGEFVAELIQWIVFMTVLFLIWRVHKTTDDRK